MNAAKARIEPRSQFMQLPGNAGIHYHPNSPDSQAMAQRLAKTWVSAIGIVEQAHGVTFIKPPKFYVCDADCFSRYTTMHPAVPAGHFMDSVFINEPVLRQRETKLQMAPENFLIHELAHLLLYQHAGALTYMQVPAWFREGLAVAVSNGAGAEACSPAEAVSHLLAGKAFDPAEAGSLFSNRTASSYGLRYPVFYRQAGMFVAFLIEIDRPAFQAALRGILEHGDFQQSFQQAYGRSLSSYWPDFMERMKRLAS